MGLPWPPGPAVCDFAMLSENPRSSHRDGREKGTVARPLLHRVGLSHDSWLCVMCPVLDVGIIIRNACYLCGNLLPVCVNLVFTQVCFFVTHYNPVATQGSDADLSSLNASEVLAHDSSSDEEEESGVSWGMANRAKKLVGHDIVRMRAQCTHTFLATAAC